MAGERRRRGVRARTTAAATIVIAVALAGGSMALVTILRQNLRDGLRDSLELRATEISSDILSGRLEPEIIVGDLQDQIAQVLDGDGDVVAASPNIAGRSPFVGLRPQAVTEIAPPLGTTPFLAYSTAFGSHQGAYTIIVAASLEDVNEPVATVKRLLLWGTPALLLIVSGTTWLMTGRALAPVESIRREVEGISPTELHRRVPASPGKDEIARLARTMNHMLDRLEDAHNRQRRFVSDASHELRSPVAAIRQHAEVALAHPDRTTPSELAETVLAEDLRVQRIVDDLLLLARADEGTLALARRPVDLDDLVFQEARRLRENDRLQVDTTAVSAGRVRGDAAGLARALRNIGENAARHATRRIAFALRTQGGSVVMKIEDDGAGIPDTERERIFERFVRLDDARARDDGGTGLGLAIVAEVVRLHGGHVAAVRSELGGAAIEITLPVEDGSRS